MQAMDTPPKAQERKRMQSRRRPHTRLLRCEHSQPRTESNVHVEEERLTALPMKTGGDQNPRTPWTPSRGPVLWSALRPPCSSAGPRCPAGRWGGPRSCSLAWGAVAERAQRQLLTQHVAQGLQEQQVGRTERPDGAWPAQLWGRGQGPGRAQGRHSPASPEGALCWPGRSAAHSWLASPSPFRRKF